MKSADEMIQFFLLVSRQGKCRLSKWYSAYSDKEKRKMVREVSQLCLNRPQKLCNFLGKPSASADSRHDVGDVALSRPPCLRW